MNKYSSHVFIIMSFMFVIFGGKGDYYSAIFAGITGLAAIASAVLHLADSIEKERK